MFDLNCLKGNVEWLAYIRSFWGGYCFFCFFAVVAIILAFFLFSTRAHVRRWWGLICGMAGRSEIGWTLGHRR